MIDPVLALSEEQQSILLDLLERHIPHCEAWAFGSRVCGRSRRYSDLDVAVIGASSEQGDSLIDLAEALAESDLPFRVDLVNWDRTSDEFRHIIERQHVVLRKPVNLETK